MKETPNYFSIIPANVRYDKDLKPNEKLLYSEITALSNKDGYCYATNKYFANLYGVSIQSISTWISNLINKGYIESELIYEDNSKEIKYRKLTVVFKKTLIPIKENFNTCIKENFKDNNININNNNYNNINKEEEIFDYYQQEIGTLTPTQYEVLLTYIDKLDTELIKEAINIAVNNGVKNMSYLKAILNNFINKGYKCISDLQKPLDDSLNYELSDELVNDLTELEQYMNDYVYNK